MTTSTEIDLSAHPDHPNKTYQYTGEMSGLLAIFRAPDGENLKLSPKKVERFLNDHLAATNLDNASPDYINGSIDPLIEPEPIEDGTTANLIHD